jgi:hypothetical protein
MREHHKAICELCFNYVTGECSTFEQRAFEHHLPNCPECRSELNDLRIAWEAIPEDMELIEPPTDLKIQVLNAVTGTGTKLKTAELPLVYSLAFRYRKWIGAITAVLVLLIFGVFWNFVFDKNQVARMVPIEQALTVSSAQIERFIELKPASYETSNTYGVACIVNNGKNKQFIVYVFGAHETVGDQAYQVWLMEDHARKSAGTFRVNREGIGVLAMPIASDSLDFDGVNISLEPDDRGREPRGEKILGSEI